MTIADLIKLVEANPNPVFIYMIIVPAAAFITAMFFEDSASGSPGKYVFSTLMYASCVPGVVAIVLTGYALLIQRTNVLNVNILVYFLPIISMALTIAIINRVVKMVDIPGFKRLSGFMMIIAVSFILVFILQRMFFGVFFVGSLSKLLLFFVVIFVVLKLGWDRLSK